MAERSYPGARRRDRAADAAADEAAVRRLAAQIGVGARGAALAEALVRGGVRTRAALLRSPALERLPAEARANVRYSPVRGMPLATARAIAEEVARRLRWGGAPDQGRPGAVVHPVGSIRRGAPWAADIDLLVVAPASTLPADFLRGAELRPPRGGDLLTFADTYAGGPRHRALIVRRGGCGRGRHYRLDLFAATRAEEPFALYHLTGSRRYNVRIRAHAKRRGWRLNQYGLYHAASGRRVAGSAAIRTEKDLAAFLGVTHRAPSDRA
jgi:DNA polymerase (family 10)